MTALVLGCLLAGAQARAAAPDRARTLVVCDDVQDPQTLDPHREFAEKNHTLVQQMFEGLVRLASNGEIEPALATEWQRIDPTRVRFRLRRGVSFHNGEPFDARAVKFSVERYLDPKTGFPALGFVATIKGVEIIDDYTVDVLTHHPDGLLINRLAGFVLVVAPTYYATTPDKQLAERPVGTGPFRFVRWERGRSVVMEANPDYWAKGLPRVSGLVFRFLPVNEQLKALRDGEIDLSTEFPGTQTTDAVRTGLLKIVKSPTFYTVTASLNVSSGPLADVRVRRALNYAVNRTDLIRYDLFGNGRELATVTMAGEEGHNASLKPYPYDPERARRLLREAGYPGGFTLRVLVKVQGERAANILASQFASLGVKLDMHMTTDASVVSDLVNNAWDAFIAGCPDPMAHSYFIQSIYLYGRSPYRVAGNPAYDSRLEGMAAALANDKRRELAEDLDRYIHEEALLLFLYQRIKTYGVRKEVDFTPAVTGMPYFFLARKEVAP